MFLSNIYAEKSSAEGRFLTVLDELKDRISKNSHTLTLDKGGSKVYQEIREIKNKYKRASKFYNIDFK